jgi:hypothetical protein
MAKGARSRLPARISAELMSRYKRGKLTLGDVGRPSGVAPSTARDRLRSAGIDTSDGRGRKKQQVQLTSDILVRYATGELNLRDVARLCRVGPNRALEALRRAGADTSRSTRKRVQFARRLGNPRLEETIATLYQEGLSTTTVGHRVGITGRGGVPS